MTTFTPAALTLERQCGRSAWPERGTAGVKPASSGFSAPHRLHKLFGQCSDRAQFFDGLMIMRSRMYQLDPRVANITNDLVCAWVLLVPSENSRTATLIRASNAGTSLPILLLILVGSE